jgi:hypothetical protein
MVCLARHALYLCLILLSTACQRVPTVEESTSSSSGNTAGATDGQAAGDPVFECDPVSQDCPEVGDRCTAIFSNGAQNLYACISDPGSLELFDTCTPDPSSGVDGCGPGLICLGDPDGTGTCVGLCLDDSDCDGALCLVDPRELVPYCALECDPFTPLCVGSVECRRVQDRFTCKFPKAGDEGFILDPCDPGTDEGCGSGVVCIQGPLIPGCESAGCCTPVCDVDDVESDTDCQAALDSVAVGCTELFMSPAPGFSGYGACLVSA